MKTLQCLVLVLFLASKCAEPSRILAAIPTASYSHQVFYQLLWRELALRGHEVVVLTTDPTHENITTLKEIDMSSVYPLWKTALRDVIALNDDKMAAYRRLAQIMHETADYELALPEVQKLIKDPREHFDLVMVEAVYPSFLALKHRFNCPLIAVTSLEGSPWLHRLMGNPTHTVLYPNNLFAGVPEMGFKERTLSFLLEMISNLVSHKIRKEILDLNLKYFGDGYPSTQDIKIDLLFLNDNPMFTEIRPLAPNSISIAGGIHMKPLRELPEDLKQFMDGSEQGVIYFSMGSNVKSRDLPNSTLWKIMETFSKVPYKVLWKFEADDLPGKPDNVKIIKWAPQQDILRHRNMKLFITQAGMQSLEEALFSQVPLITIPFMADQDANAGRVAFKELGLKLNYKTLTVDEFKESILEVITNPKYKENVKRLSLQLQDQPMTPLERAIWWTEYVLRNKGGEHLKGPTIPFYQFYYLDVLGVLGLSSTFVLMGLWFVSRGVYKFTLRRLSRVSIKVKKA